MRSARRADGLEHVHRPDDVHAARRAAVGAAERDLQGSEVDHVRDAMLVERALEAPRGP
jgi:hypothetical protein